MANWSNDVSAKKPLRVAVAGYGLIGQRHAKLIGQHDEIELAGIADPLPKNRALAAELGCPVTSDVETLLATDEHCSAVVIATPNNTHLEIGQLCMERGLPVLIEKPVAADLQEAERLVSISNQTRVPVLVGHHRRHHAQAKQLREMVSSGELGTVLAAQITWCLRKPNTYFKDAVWRNTKGGGPVWINLIHEIDMLRFVLGDITEVSAMLGNMARDAGVEDTGVINLRFESGTIASIILSDATPSPWHFEGASGENPNIRATGMDGMRLFGTTASVSFPSMKVWSHGGLPDGGWGDEISVEEPEASVSMGDEIALREQLDHFAKIIRREAQPLVSAQDGLESMRVVDAIHQSAMHGRNILLNQIHEQFRKIS